MCLIVGELLPQKNWLETSHFCAKTDSRLPSIVARGCWPLIIWKSDAPLPSFPHRSCKTVQWGPIPLLQARCIPIEPGYDPAWQSPRTISQSDAFQWILPAYQRQVAATPAGNGLFICLILFCSQYVMISYTQYTLNKVCIGLFVFIPT